MSGAQRFRFDAQHPLLDVFEELQPVPGEEDFPAQPVDQRSQFLFVAHSPTPARIRTSMTTMTMSSTTTRFTSLVLPVDGPFDGQHDQPGDQGREDSGDEPAGERGSVQHAG